MIAAVRAPPQALHITLRHYIPEMLRLSAMHRGCRDQQCGRTVFLAVMAGGNHPIPFRTRK